MYLFKLREVRGRIEYLIYGIQTKMSMWMISDGLRIKEIYIFSFFDEKSIKKTSEKWKIFEIQDSMTTLKWKRFFKNSKLVINKLWIDQKDTYISHSNILINWLITACKFAYYKKKLIWFIDSKTCHACN